MTLTYHEAVRAQGANLKASRRSVEASLHELDLAPWRTGRLALLAMGASYNALIGFARVLRRSNPDVSLFSSSEFVGDRLDRGADGVIAVSQSGRSVETVDALTNAGALPRLLVTGDPEAPARTDGTAVVGLDLMDDSAVYTLGFTGSLQALALLAAELGGDDPGRRWDLVADEVDRILEDAEPFAAQAAEALSGVSAIDIVASAEHLAAAAETGLILREACHVPSSVFETRQYLHGPMESLQPGRALLAVGDGRELAVAEQAVDVGAVAIVLTTSTAPASDRVSHRYAVPAFTDLELATLEIVPAQLVVGALAAGSELAIESFRYQQPDTKIPEVSS